MERTSMELIEFTQIDTSFAIPPQQLGDARRRLMTFVAEPSPTHDPRQHCEVLRATNTAGEVFALKRLLPLPSDQVATARKGREAALFEEYRCQVAVSQLQGFPRAVGYGISSDGSPAILMEWIEGPTLLEAARAGLLPGRIDAGSAARAGQGASGDPVAPGGVESGAPTYAASTVAAIASAALTILVSTSYLDGTFAHRDLSPRNIMFAIGDSDEQQGGQDAGTQGGSGTGDTTRGGRHRAEEVKEELAQQVRSGTLDLRLVDLGSASFVRSDQSSFTTMHDVWRFATPTYAAPEMLTYGPQDGAAAGAGSAPTQAHPARSGQSNDAAAAGMGWGIETAERTSPAVDIYALASVLYELYCGRVPFDVGSCDLAHARAIKVSTPAPRPLLHDPADEPLITAIMDALAADPAARPRASTFLARVTAWQQARGLITRPQEPADQPGRIALLSTRSIATHLTKENDGVGARAMAGAGAPYATGIAAPGSPAGAVGSPNATEALDPATLPAGAGITRAAAAAPLGAGTGAAPTAPTTPTEATATARPAPSRRRAIGLALGTMAAVGVAALGGAAWMTRGFGLMGPKPFAELTPAELIELAHAISATGSATAATGVARAHGLLTDTGGLRTDLITTLTGADGTARRVQLVGYFHDELADDTTEDASENDSDNADAPRAGLTLCLLDPIGTHPMASSPMASGGWKDSEGRAWLAKQLHTVLPAELAAQVRTVRKRSNNAGGTTDPADVTVTADQLWLFSVVELAAQRGPSTFSPDYRFLADIMNAEGTQYQLWREQGVTARSGNTPLERTSGTQHCAWWTRSASADVSAENHETWFNRVGTNGDPFHFAAPATGSTDDDDGNATTIMLPGFCL